MNNCIYCNTVNKATHFCCDACGAGMCDDCYKAGTEHEWHYHNPIELISPNMKQALSELVAEGRGPILEPTYLCDLCVDSSDNYLTN